MKILIASDVHGSSFAIDEIIKRLKEENADKLVLLGDVYNHGPRNPLPKDYAPLKVAETLNAIKDKLIVVKGNCDSQVDTLISEFDFIENLCLVIGEKTLLLTHGHVYNKDSLPKTKFDYIIYGHFHTGFIEKRENATFINAGSISLPKCDTPASYLIVSDEEIILKTLDGKVIDKTQL